MNTITLLSIICICIELWHLVYWNLLYNKYFKRPEAVIKWAESYKKLYHHFMEFTDYYIENLDLQYALGLHFNEPLVNIIDMFKQVDGEHAGSHKILNLCPIRYLMLFLLQQFIEMVYWIILVVLAVIMPSGTGLLLFIVLWLIGRLQLYCNKKRNVLWINLDSLLCICIFVLVVLKYF